ncbi:MAG: PEP-CTERM sorting domain-containing protein [Candidatus Ancaeobacter aquaticus]|nr:PEP-CTERM sorting domain-containing protein [Candidatus Ancaeobacter aquaticus]
MQYNKTRKIFSLNSSIIGILFFVFVLQCGYVNAATLDASNDTLDNTGATTASSTYVDVTGFSTTANLPGGLHSVLAIATFSSQSGGLGGSRVGSWRLTDGTTNSTGVSRFLSGANDLGLVSAVSVFSGVSNTDTISLQHQSTASKSVTTRSGNLVVIPLTSSDSSVVLNSGMKNNAAAYDNTSESLTAVTGLATSVALASAGKIAVFCTIETETGDTGSGARTGTWDLQVETSPNSGTYSTIGSSTQRYLSGTSDTGSVTLMAVSDQLSSTGTFNVRVRTSTDDAGKSIITQNATLAAVTLSDSGATGEHFESFQATVASDTTNSTTLTNVAGLSPSLTLDEAGKVFVGAQYNLEIVTSSDIDATTAVGFSTYTDQSQGRYIAKTTGEIGNGSSVGLTGSLAAGTYDGNLQYAVGDVADTLQMTNPNLIGFAMNSVPEPSTYALFGMGILGFFIAGRKRFIKK